MDELVLDLVCVVAEQNRGWILDAVGQNVAARAPGTAEVHYGTAPFPPARAYFYTHYSLWEEVFNKGAPRGRHLVLFTHPSHHRRRQRKVARSLRAATKVVAMCQLHVPYLSDLGVAATRISVENPGTDPQRFPSHARPGDGTVGMCAAYYERKSPRLLIDVVASLPQCRFLLVGKGWQGTAALSELQRFERFRYVEAPYERYPSLYREMDVLLSPGSVEGGPIPLLEGMMSGVVPVASRTGFAPDLIDHGRNGYLFDVGTRAHEVAGLVQRALSCSADVRRSVVHLTEARYAAAIWALASRTDATA